MTTTRTTTRPKRLARLVAVCLGAAVCWTAAPSAGAQQALGIAAIVNDDIVSVYDLEARLSMIIATSGLPNTVETRQRLAAQVLRGLIDEKLKNQEAKRLGIQVTKRDVDRALGTIAQQNNIPLERLDAFLASEGIHKPTLIEKIEADVAWIKAVNSSLRAGVDIDDKAVDRFVEQVESEQGQIENHVAEIFLPVDDAAKEPQVRETAERMIEQIRSGASFSALAQTFSQSATAAVTGDLGWLKKGDLDEDLEAAVAKLEPGQTSAPIRSVSGYHILNLLERRRAGGLPKSEVTVDLQQVFFPLPGDASEADIRSQMELAKTTAESAESCEDMQRLGKELGSSLSGGMKDVKVGGLAPALREVVAPLPVQKVSEPVRTASGVVLLMVCERRGGDLSQEQRDRLRDMLVNRRLDEAARRYLRDIQRSAFVDVRL